MRDAQLTERGQQWLTFRFTAQKRSVCIGPVDSLTDYRYLRRRPQREPLQISILSNNTRSANDAAYQHSIQPQQETRQLSICAVWMYEAFNCGHADLLCAATPPASFSFISIHASCCHRCLYRGTVSRWSGNASICTTEYTRASAHVCLISCWIMSLSLPLTELS